MPVLSMHNLGKAMTLTSSLVLAWFFLPCLVFSQDVGRRDSDMEQSGCSFQREGFTYNIYLTHTADGGDHLQTVQGPGESSKNCGGSTKRVVLDDQIQNDYTAKLVDMERNFSFLKDTHESRIKELEGTLQKLVASSVTDGSDASSRAAQAKDNIDRFNIGNEELMKRLEAEFNELRTDLREKSTELLDTKAKLNDTSTRMHEEQIQRFQTSQQLLNAENQITMLKRERAVLKNQLKDRSYKLSVSSNKAQACEKKNVRQQDEVMKLFRSEATLKEELSTAEYKLNRTKNELKVLEVSHKDLKARQDRMRRIMKLRERELINCYTAKTSTFCGFEDPKMCGFSNINDTTDFFDWQRIKGATPSSRTGPSKDHTCNTPTGHFMYIEASAKGRGSNAILYSPLYRGLTEQCVEFFYHMYGRHIGTLNVYAKARGDVLQTAWRAYGNQGDIWTNARLSIPEALARAGYQIAFEGITQNGYQGDISIDDVSVTDGPCPLTGTVTATPVKVNETALDLGLRKDKISRKLRRKQKKRRGQRNT